MKAEKRVTSDSDEHALHSCLIRQVLDKHGIDLPYCVNLDGIVQYIFDEIRQNVASASSIGVPASDPSRGKILLNMFDQTFPPAFFKAVNENFSSIRKELNDYTISFIKDKRPGGNEDTETNSENNVTKKKNSKKKKNEKVAEPVDDTTTDVGKSTHPCYYRRIREDCGMKLTLNEIAKLKQFFDKTQQIVEDLLASGDFVNGVDQIALAVMMSEQSEETLNNYKMRLAPDLMTCVLGRISWHKKDFADQCNSTKSEMQDIAQKLSRNKPIPSHEAHSFHLLRILANCGVHIPRSQEFTAVFGFFIEQKITSYARLLADKISTLSPGEVASIIPIDYSNGQEWLLMFEKVLSTKHFRLVQKKINLINKKIDDYIISTSKERQARTSQSLNESIANDASTSITHAENTANPIANSSVSKKKKQKKKKIERPESISADSWQQFYDLGRHVSDFVLDAFELFGSGDFSSWDKNRMKDIVSSIDKRNESDRRYKRNTVYEYVFVERMKDKEFFCCVLCQETLFNWKQALIHFTSDSHKKNETCTFNAASVVEGFHRVLNSFTELPAKLSTDDIRSHREKCTNSMSYRREDCIPSADFVVHMYDKYSSLATIKKSDNYVKSLSEEELSEMQSNKLLFGAKTLIERAKSEIGRKAMAELHEHIGLRKTYCTYCCCETGTREEYYAHLLCATHVHNMNEKVKLPETYCGWCCCETGNREEVYAHFMTPAHVYNSKTVAPEDLPSTRYCLLTLLVNVHRKDLI